MDMKKMAADLLYPPRCPACGEIIGFEQRNSYYQGRPGYSSYVHAECFGKLPFPDANCCERCGTVIREDKRLCEECLERERPFDLCMSAFLYDGVIKKALYDLKYNNKKEYSEFFSYAMWERLGERIGRLRPDVLVPVPVHRDRKRSRGYNQAQLLAEHLGRLSGIPAAELLLRSKKTQAQKELSPEERRKNLADAFELGSPLPEGIRVLLVDDIYTTGSTMDICSFVLKIGGAAKVFGITCATARERNG